MGRISKILLNSFIISATADYIQVTSCNDETLYPALSMKITREYFENYLSEEMDLFHLSQDGAFYERTMQENDLTLSFDNVMDGEL